MEVGAATNDHGKGPSENARLLQQADKKEHSWGLLCEEPEITGRDAHVFVKGSARTSGNLTSEQSGPKTDLRRPGIDVGKDEHRP